MWIAITVVSGIASLGGYVFFQSSSPDTVAVVLAFAAEAILTMLGNTMMPEALRAHRKAGRGGHHPGLRRRIRPRLTHLSPDHP